MGSSNTSGSNLPNKRILRKTLLSAVSEGSSLLLFLFGVLIARTLGPSGYGEFTYALAYCALFVLVIESGLGELLTRDLSHDSVQGRRVLQAGLGVQIILTPIIILLLITSVHLFQPDITSSFVIFTVLIAVVSRALKSSLRGLLRGSGEFGVESISMACERVGLAFLGMFAFIGGWDLELIVTAFAVFKLIDLVILVAYIHFRIVKLIPSYKPDELKWLVLRLMPFSVTMAIWVLYNYTDMMMLGYFRNADEVGRYGAIYQLFEGMIVIPSILGAVFLPWMSYEFKKGKEGVGIAMRKGMRLLIAASIPVVCVSLFAPTEVIILIFGSDFSDAAPGLSILLGSAPFVFLFWFLRGGFIAIHKTKALVIITALGVTFNIITNLVAIPRYGLFGACATTLLTEILTFLLAVYVMSKNGIHGPGIEPWMKSMAAGVVLVVTMLTAEYMFNWALLGVPAGLIFFHLVLCRFGFWTADERITLRKWNLSW
jgi:O-antigen/teichoic acid export membrane protein